MPITNKYIYEKRVLEIQSNIYIYVRSGKKRVVEKKKRNWLIKTHA